MFAHAAVRVLACRFFGEFAYPRKTQLSPQETHVLLTIVVTPSRSEGYADSETQTVELGRMTQMAEGTAPLVATEEGDILLVAEERNVLVLLHQVNFPPRETIP